MKRQKGNLLFVAMAFAMMLLLPASAIAQPPCHNGVCPPGYVCIDGHCKKLSVPCNCFRRPIPPECGQACGFLVDPTQTDQLLAVADQDPLSISIAVIEDQQVSLRIYDITGRLIKVIADDRMMQGVHQIEWNKTDEAGSAVSAGLYVVRLDTEIHQSRS